MKQFRYRFIAVLCTALTAGLITSSQNSNSGKSESDYVARQNPSRSASNLGTSLHPSPKKETSTATLNYKQLDADYDNGLNVRSQTPIPGNLKAVDQDGSQELPASDYLKLLQDRSQAQKIIIASISDAEFEELLREGFNFDRATLTSNLACMFRRNEMKILSNYWCWDVASQSIERGAFTSDGQHYQTD